MTESQFNELVTWAQTTFPHSTIVSKLKLEKKKTKSNLQYIDCLFLITEIMKTEGLTLKPKTKSEWIDEVLIAIKSCENNISHFVTLGKLLDERGVVRGGAGVIVEEEDIEFWKALGCRTELMDESEGIIYLPHFLVQKNWKSLSHPPSLPPLERTQHHAKTYVNEYLQWPSTTSKEFIKTQQENAKKFLGKKTDEEDGAVLPVSKKKKIKKVVDELRTMPKAMAEKIKMLPEGNPIWFDKDTLH